VSPISQFQVRQTVTAFQSAVEHGVGASDAMEGALAESGILDIARERDDLLGEVHELQAKLDHARAALTPGRVAA
jgi:hypothetical protein